MYLILSFYRNLKLILIIIKQTTQKNKGLNSSTDVANEILRVFGTKISSGYVRKIRRQYSMFK
jgi:hypothetical protein